MTTAIATVETREIARADEEWSVERMIEQSKKIQECMRAVMKQGEHYGVIPGTKGKDGEAPKPTLLKPGAEKLCLMFRLDPEYEIVSAVEASDRIAFTIRCVLTHIPTQTRIASGLGSCNSREGKYVRPAPKKCPKCGGEFLITGKPEYERDAEYKGGMLCYQKKGGCGAKFKPGDEAIEKQPTGIADPSDLHNTILKMACKRALVAAVLNGTAASDCFTQDLDDLAEKAAEYIPPTREAPQDAGKGSGPTGSTMPSANAASAGSTATTSRPAGATTATTSNAAKDYVPANKIAVKPGDPMAKPAQVDRINELRVQCLDEQTFRLTWLGAYKNHDGKRIEKPADLTFDQAANLIKRMTAHAQRQGERLERMGVEGAANLSAVLPQPEPPLEDLLTKTFRFPDDERSWLKELFGVEEVGSLERQDAEAALALLMAGHGTPAYAEVMTKLRALGRVA
jgi:hypothetical protein